PKHLKQIYKLYDESEPYEIPDDLNFIWNYSFLDKNVFINIIIKLVDRSNESLVFIHLLYDLLDFFREDSQEMLALFQDNLNLLKKVYFLVSEQEPSFDIDGQIFAYILKQDSKFILEYIDRIYKSKEDSKYYSFNEYNDTRNYSFIWRENNYEEIVSQTLESFYERNNEYPELFYETIYLEKIFMLMANAKDNDILKQRQNFVLKKLIENRHEDIDYIEFLFCIICNFSHERIRSFLALFLNLNKNFEDFKKLCLEPSTISWTGSAVPMYQGRIDYWESLIPMLNTLNFLEHRQHIERKISSLRERIEQEKKKDFMEV
ncbi:MAG: hypothetical protein ACRC11_09680, partial [Xenococcaceae cyanobacterium]